ncbi:bifunctional proline dehydrogenase/L-glutamate gamma-semialdehyde dehydrogenase PutA [Methylobacter sp. YRD-M1]|uniref:bifunctional proline dehydrogenase/L-glutamate gamma-semialdehyde dehydrogenase PutA n=1 Tax=Methylobacter sp. YRD-M1 TaxID=2911520 RepID=UPI00227B511B|nr:bifunctional proline dehydrogenase/L-glutamate gamma-semialdehyde dehydrogenase PutA [Methylobacter sp. YRD-M1]WAK03501.1 bifunctional proline dehydrogenase/L-glutamate gamma-semialdehyde dehydrogenase PutA [Methylobacter sp. YRD-M1]
MADTSTTTLRAAINQAYLADEKNIIAALSASLNQYDAAAVSASAETLVNAVRARKRHTAIEAFLHEYQLNSQEGIVLMSIAEALLRIPDRRTQDQFLQEKLTVADWQRHVQQSDSFWVNLSTRALVFTRQFEELTAPSEQHWFPVFEQLLSRMGAPLIRNAINQAMQHMALQFVIAETIEQAIAHSEQQPAYRYSFDMLGEAALTSADAERYFQSYARAIAALAGHAGNDDLYSNPGISVKLSALCPRYELLQRARAISELTDRLLHLANHARAANISLTVDAEESERLDMSLTIFAAVLAQLDGWPGLGLAVQAYQKRALPVIRWLAALAESRHCRIPLRLVKGAYWDSEIKRAQENGLSDYPVFTHKSSTDVSYLACAQFILSRPDVFYPQFASHNAHTLAAVHQMGRRHPGYEFQRLHGMGEALYVEIIEHQGWQVPCRVYAPVGHYHELLPYLVRRLLENGANTSFVNQIDHPDISVTELTGDPVATVKMTGLKSPIVLPRAIYGEKRLNSSGVNLADPEVLNQLQQDLNALADRQWMAAPLIDGQLCSGEEQVIVNPWDNRLTVGTVSHAGQETIERALESAARAFDDWRHCPVETRAACLKRAADLFEQHRLELVSLCVREGGRTIRDALSEVREAVDFCRYYAQSALELFNEPIRLPGPVGEDNRLYHYGRGVYICISPWNFPIAIFTGQIAAALAAGNAVIAKPASQTSLTAMHCVHLLHQAGIPESVLQFVPADGRTTGQYVLPHPQVAGIAFTGSTATAQFINRQLAEHHPAIVPIIAETGGQNALIADSSALPEQLVQDALLSAFNSAGQRCSALRVLFVQEEIADKTIAMLTGAMQELVIGNPGLTSTDIGPVIDHAALGPLTAHLETMKQQARLFYQLPLGDALRHGSFIAPTLIEIDSLSQLTQEVFGPILHLIRYRAAELDQVIAAVNATGYGLTLGIHSRIAATAEKIRQGAKVGNVYINRNMIGAVVGVQPFGGMRLSGTGPKAGGPDYLRRFVVEQTVTTNTAAVGGNATLLTQDLR